MNLTNLLFCNRIIKSGSGLVYILLIIFSVFLTYQICLSKKDYNKKDKLKIISWSFIVTTILNHIFLYAYFGNMSLVYLNNSITISFIMKYIIISIITSNISAYLINNLSFNFIKENTNDFSQKN